ncbi:Transporter of the ATP-binding cassette (ABC), partial [Coemansia sp. RSA 2603]
MATYAPFSARAAIPWPSHDDASRTQALWPAILHTALFFTLLTLGIRALPRVLRRPSAEPPKPIRCPPSGGVTLVDNRVRVGAVCLALSVAHTCIVSVWWTHSGETPERLVSAMLMCAVAVLVLLLVFYARLLESNRFLHRGLAPWPVALLVAVQVFVGACESYFSFFTPQHRDEQVIGRTASVRSNCLTASTIASALLLVSLSMVQQRPYFMRPLHGDAPEVTPAAAYADRCAASADDSTPLAPPRTVDSVQLVDTPEYSASWFSRLTFSWPNDLLAKGVRRQLEYTDLYRLDDKDMPAHAWRRYQTHRRDGRSLVTTLLITFAPELTIQCVLALVESVLLFSGPFFLQRILRSIDVLGSKP